MMSDRTCYVYKFTYLPNLMWYVGVRSSKGCHPNDGYQSSSKIVKASVKANPELWKKEIIDTGTIEDMRQLEAEILQLVDAANDKRSFNKHNSAAKFRFDKTGIKEKDSTRAKKSKSHIGKKRPEHAAALRGKKQAPERIAHRAALWKGKHHSENTKQVMSEKATVRSAKLKGVARSPIIVAKIKAGVQRFLKNKSLLKFAPTGLFDFD